MERTLPHVADVDAASFDTAVVERSRDVPVIVDLWATWCGPCHTLGPMLEAAVARRDGAVELAKVDVDANPQLAQRFRVQGIPYVLGFRDGEVVASFSGAVPPERIEGFIEQLLPSEADRAVARARSLDEEAAVAELERALELEPDHRDAAVALAELLVSDDPQQALELIRAHRPHPAAEAVATRVELSEAGDVDVDALRSQVESGDPDGDTLLAYGRGLAARGEHGEAIEVLLRAVETGGEAREDAREQLVSLFGVLGDADPRVAAARPRLARALF